VNRRVTVTIEQQNRDPTATEPWTVELAYTYDPAKLRFDDALDIRPRIAFTERLLRVTGDYLDDWLRERIKERAKEQREGATP
jgi:hypothetical protein